jgi:ketosteroid isomerase-like protein
MAARLAAVEDRLAIIELEASYARRFDARDGDAWAALFTEDGVYQARGATLEGGGLHVRGRDALMAFCSNAPFDGIHLLHLPQVTFDGDTARSRMHLEFVGRFHSSGSPTVRVVGYYDVSYVRCADGWSIARRVTTTFSRHDTSTSRYAPGNGLDE